MKYEYVVGDRLLCKKGMRKWGSFTKGNYYVVSEIYNLDLPVCIIKDDFEFRTAFSDSIGIRCSLKDYFYTKKEIRIMKLKKINGI